MLTDTAIFFLAGLFLILTVAFVFALAILRLSKAKKKFKQSGFILDPEDWVVEFLSKIDEKFADSLDMLDALDEVVASLSTVFSFSSASYLLSTNGHKVTFKAHLVQGVSSNYLNDLKSKVVADYERYSKKGVKELQWEEFIVGSPINDDNPAKLGGFLSVPIYVQGSVAGVFALTPSGRKPYGEAERAFVGQVISRIMDSTSRLERVVLREKEKLQAMVDSMHDGVLLVDPKLTVLVVNPAVSKMLNFREGTLPNVLDVAEYFSQSVKLEDKISQVLATGSPANLSEIQVGEFYYEISLIPVRVGENIVGVGIVIQDVTKDVELARLRRDFSAMVIHDLRSPLTVMKGTADLLISRIGDLKPEQISSFLSQIKLSTMGLLDMVNDLLDAAKIEEGKIELFKVATDLGQLLLDVKSYYFTLAQQRQIELLLDVDKSVGSVDLDNKKVRQVMNNLISNALKFTEPGGQVGIRLQDKGSFAEISVWDTGSGVSDDLKGKIFERFVQGKEADHKGTGLGLVIVKGIVEAHGGKIWVEDNEPKGARFIFALPKS